MSNQGLNLVCQLFSEQYPVSLTEHEGQEIARNLAGFFEVLNEWDLKRRYIEIEGIQNDI